MNYEWFALAAAGLWAISSLASVTAARHLGTFAYSRWRMGCTALILSLLAYFTGGWETVHASHVLPMALSGLIGIFIGDTSLFACMNKMGPRRSGLLFSCNSVFSALLGYWLFGETFTNKELFGSTLVFSGVLVAILFGRRVSNSHHWEQVKGSIFVGIGLGLLAAFCQSMGGVLAKPVMQTDIDPIAASAIRMVAAFAAHSLFRLTGNKLSLPTQKMNEHIFLMTAFNGIIAMVIGMTLILYALQTGNIGMVALLSSTTPIIILPLLWLCTKQRPSVYAWLGAIIAVSGTAIIVV